MASDKERLFPMQRDYNGRDKPNPPLPWAVAQAVYEHLYVPYAGPGCQTLERLAERGGFSYEEIRSLAELLSQAKKRNQSAKTEATHCNSTADCEGSHGCACACQFCLTRNPSAEGGEARR